MKHEEPQQRQTTTDKQTITDRKSDIDKAAGKRWSERKTARKAKADQIREKGVLEAAGFKAAVGRVGHMTVPEGRSPEALVGQDDSDHVNFLDRGARAARAVCRLNDGRTPMGSGFLIAPGLLLTNNHVIGSAEEAARFVAEFDAQLDVDDNPLRPRRFELTPAIFHTSVALDYTVVSVARQNADGDELTAFGWLPLEPRTDKVLEGEPIVTIGHPNGREKRLCMFHSELVDREGEYLTYTTDTEPGSSGSPAFNRSWQVVGLHHASVTAPGETRAKSIVVNEGVRTSSIMKDLSKAPKGSVGEAVYRQLLDPVTSEDGRPVAVATVAPSGIVSPRLPAEAEPGLEAAATVLRRRPASHFAGRDGYDERFLAQGQSGSGAQALVVPLPRIDGGDVAPLIGGGDELKYLHYSIKMCASRRTAYYAAANIDGATIEHLDREDRTPLLEAAADTWYFDPRMDEGFQLGPRVFDKTLFVFGHMNRRLDTVWGDDLNQKRIANDDTFHITNCAPQHTRLNSGSWGTLEDAVLAFAENGQRRVTVITGPVLDPSDPEILDVLCPTSFFKVVAWRTNGALRAAGFMQWQTKFVNQIIRDLEDLGDKKPTFHVRISEIERVTSLDFGPLSKAGVEIVPGNNKRRRITNAKVAEILGS